MDELVIAGRRFRSRLMLGTGKHPSMESMAASIAASETEIVTVAVRRIDLDAKDEGIVAFLPDHVLLLANTAGSATSRRGRAHSAWGGGGGGGFRLAVEPAGARGCGLMPERRRGVLAAGEPLERMSTCRVNGRRYVLDPDETIAALLVRLEIAARYTLVERNGEPVERERYEEVRLADGDSSSSPAGRRRVATST